jgi:hypothetical protein
VESTEAGLEQRLSSLQAQIDNLRQGAVDDVLPLEQRLSTLTEHSAGILKRWADTADRHARAVSQLETHLHELGDAGARLQQDASHRLQDLERIVEHEWTALRDLHEAPVRQLVEQAASLTEVCIATANSAQHGFDRAEARLSALEADFHRTTSELTREVQALLAEVRQLSGGGPRQLAADSAAWPLEGVTRLHQQLRESGGDGVRALPAAVLGEPPDPSTPSMSSIDRESPEPGLRLSPEPTDRGFSSRPLVLAIVAALIIAAGAFAWRLQRDVRAVAARADQSQLQSRIAEAASREAAVKQEAADRELVAARDLATRAQTIGDVLAAPDLQRYTLVSPGSLLPAASGQVLWSRSRGFVFTASGLPAPPRDRTYQVWLVTRGGAVSAATFVPDAAGRVTVTTTLSIPRPVVAAIITTEPKDGSPRPTGDAVLARLPAAVPPPES